eukprot:2467677-Pyramimonas_sp.AAC.1
MLSAISLNFPGSIGLPELILFARVRQRIRSSKPLRALLNPSYEARGRAPIGRAKEKDVYTNNPSLFPPH